MNLDFFLPQILQLDTSSNLLCIVLLTREFSLTVFSYHWHNLFQLFYVVYLTAFSGFLIYFTLLCFLNTLFTETDLSWLIYKPIKALEIITLFSSCLVVFYIWPCFFLFFVIIDSCFFPVFLETTSWQQKQKKKKMFRVIQSPVHYFIFFTH